MGEVIFKPEISGAPRQLGRPGAPHAPATRAAPQEPSAEQRLRDENAALRAALQDVQNDLDAARSAAAAELARVRDAAAQEKAGAHAQAARAGFDEGRRQGLAEGRRAADEAAAARLAEIDKLMRSLADARRRVLADTEAMVVESIFAGVCRVVGAHALEPRVLRASIAAARAAYGAADGVRVAIHPADQRLLAETATPEWLARAGLVADEAVGRGGCIVRGPEGELDARLETQAGLLQAALLAAHGGEERADA